MNAKSELFDIRFYAEIINIDLRIQRDVVFRVGIDKMEPVDFAEIHINKEDRRIKLNKGVEFMVRLDCFHSFKNSPLFFFITTTNYKKICGTGIEINSFLIDAFRTSPAPQTHKAAVRLENAYREVVGDVTLKIAVRHISSDLSNIYCCGERGFHGLKDTVNPLLKPAPDSALNPHEIERVTKTNIRKSIFDDIVASDREFEMLPDLLYMYDEYKSLTNDMEDKIDDVNYHVNSALTRKNLEKMKKYQELRRKIDPLQSRLRKEDVADIESIQSVTSDENNISLSSHEQYVQDLLFEIRRELGIRTKVKRYNFRNRISKPSSLNDQRRTELEIDLGKSIPSDKKSSKDKSNETIDSTILKRLNKKDTKAQQQVSSQPEMKSRKTTSYRLAELAVIPKESSIKHSSVPSRTSPVKTFKYPKKEPLILDTQKPQEKVKQNNLPDPSENVQTTNVKPETESLQPDNVTDATSKAESYNTEKMSYISQTNNDSLDSKSTGIMNEYVLNLDKAAKPAKEENIKLSDLLKTESRRRSRKKGINKPVSKPVLETIDEEQIEFSAPPEKNLKEDDEFSKTTQIEKSLLNSESSFNHTATFDETIQDSESSFSHTITLEEGYNKTTVADSDHKSQDATSVKVINNIPKNDNKPNDPAVAATKADDLPVTSKSLIDTIQIDDDTCVEFSDASKATKSSFTASNIISVADTSNFVSASKGNSGSKPNSNIGDTFMEDLVFEDTSTTHEVSKTKELKEQIVEEDLSQLKSTQSKENDNSEFDFEQFETDNKALSESLHMSLDGNEKAKMSSTDSGKGIKPAQSVLSSDIESMIDSDKARNNKKPVMVDERSEAQSLHFNSSESGIDSILKSSKDEQHSTLPKPEEKSMDKSAHDGYSELNGLDSERTDHGGERDHAAILDESILSDFQF